MRPTPTKRRPKKKMPTRPQRATKKRGNGRPVTRTTAMRKIKCSKDDVRRWDATWQAVAKKLGIGHMTYTDFIHHLLNREAKEHGIK